MKKTTIIISIIIITTTTLLLGGCTCTVKYKEVKKIGGCNRSSCTVLFTDGTVGTAYPNLGEAIEGAKIAKSICK